MPEAAAGAPPGGSLPDSGESRPELLAVPRTDRRPGGLDRALRAGLRAGAMATGRARLLPSYLIIGAKRGGSTSLQHYLAQHPAIQPPNVAKGSHYFDVNHARGWAWYRSHFPLARPGVITGEASPYYVFHPLALPRIAAALPRVKLILVLRDPVLRAWSHHQDETRRGFEQLPFAAAIDAEPERLAGEPERLRADPTYSSLHHRRHSYVARGLYRDQLDAVYALFPAAQVHVVLSERLFAHPQHELPRLHGFLGLPYVPVRAPARHKAGHYPALAGPLRERLAARFEEPNKRLADTLGLDPGWMRPR